MVREILIHLDTDYDMNRAIYRCVKHEIDGITLYYKNLNSKLYPNQYIMRTPYKNIDGKDWIDNKKINEIAKKLNVCGIQQNLWW